MEKEGLWERTVVIVAADHGEELFERGWIGHNVHLYEPSVRVPLIVRFPKGAGRPAGASPPSPTSSTWVPRSPTSSASSEGGLGPRVPGAEPPAAIEGAAGKPAVLSRTVWDRPRYALRDERYKFFYDSRTGEERLYDLEADPGETRDAGPAEPLRAAYYRQALHAWTLKLAAGGRPAARRPR